MDDQKKGKSQEPDGATPDGIIALLRKMSMRDRFKYLVSNITVEPLLACYIMPSVLAGLATQNLNLEKACRVNLRYDKHVCDALSARETANYTEEETQVQQLVAGMTVWKTILQSALPALLMLFMGAWTDRHGCRKPCMLLPIVGEFLTSIGLIVCTYFFDELPMEVAGVVEALFPALTGGWFTMFMAVFSYLGDVTSVEMRTLRIGVVNVFVSLGVPVGMALSGVLYRQIGFYGIFSISAVMYVIAFLYGLFVLKEEKKPRPEAKKMQDQTCWFLRDFFDWKHITETFKVAFKHGKDQRRMRVIMLMVACMVIIGPMHDLPHENKGTTKLLPNSKHAVPSEMISSLEGYIYGKCIHICVEGEWKTICEKSPINTPDRDSNFDLPVIGSLVHCQSSALDHVATEAGSFAIMAGNDNIHQKLQFKIT
uniref:Solute carrier family 46 member 3 n=1 Tax=Timema tahoe TaxID=61484 RepID=A0A7R9IMU7_9NEOP|nr:unnamed protein product [Timema tahoe]